MVSRRISVIVALILIAAPPIDGFTIHRTGHVITRISSSTDILVYLLIAAAIRIGIPRRAFIVGGTRIPIFAFLIIYVQIIAAAV